MAKKNSATYLPDPKKCPNVMAIRNNPLADKADSWIITEDIMNPPKQKTVKPEKVFDENDAIIKQLQEEKAAKKSGNKKKEKPTVDLKEKPKEPKGKTKKRLTEDDVRNIRTAAKNGTKNSILAEEYKVTQPCIWNIVQGNTWKHIK